jgi:diguanylate cyclase (GGDEF)-like protein
VNSTRQELLQDLVEQERAAARRAADDEAIKIVTRFQTAGAFHGSAVQQALYQNDFKAIEQVVRERISAEAREQLTAEDTASDIWLTRAKTDLDTLLETEFTWAEERGREREQRHGQPGNFTEWVKPQLERDRQLVNEECARELRILRNRRELSASAEATRVRPGTRDVTTGLFDRSTFNSHFAADCESALKMDRPLALLFVDIDHFKTVNDTFGHPKGDVVLATVAGLLQAIADGKGNVYRYGGEEMVVVLPNHSVEEAVSVAERMRRAIEKQETGEVSVTASFGVAVLPEHSATADELLTAADKAVYDAKSLGRNLVRVFGEPAPAQPREQREPERRHPAPAVAPSSRVIEDKWVNGSYIEEAGIRGELEKTGWNLKWVNANDENSKIDLEGWEHILWRQLDGTPARLKIRDTPAIGGYLVLLGRRKP